MHYLAKPLLPEKPDLSKVDQLGSTPDMPKNYMDSNSICRNGNKGCKGARGRIVAYDPDTHRNRRHYYKKRYAACYECRAYPPEHPVCRRRMQETLRLYFLPSFHAIARLDGE
ncbi:hypothetical protein NXS19_010745 [Fusarium pseudograminearum]|nr:hypothetical protein NXS19_010745 [Fusarium pseudograminearum]